MRTVSTVVATGVFITAAALAILPVAAATLFRARRLYAAYTTRIARAVLATWRVRVRLDGRLPGSGRQVVYVSNHTSTLDLFVLVALGLPNTRFFLSGFLQKFLPLAILARLMGTFFTVPQDQPEERRRIFARACRTLVHTGESVYLSPEGGRITTGEIGPFNKGAFHLATELGAPIVPLYFVIPPAIDPGVGYAASGGEVTVLVKPHIPTAHWQLADVVDNTQRVRERFVAWNRDAHLTHLHQ